MKNYTEAERQEHLEKWKSGTLSKAAYAKSAGIYPTTFYTWTREKRSRGKKGFVEINKKLLLKPSQNIIIEKGTYTIRVPLSVEVKELHAVFSALEGIS